MSEAVVNEAVMSSAQLSSKPKRLMQRKLGWIGVDVGTSSLKVVQVARSKQGWRVAASAVVPRQRPWQAAAAVEQEVVSSLDEIKAARSLQEGYRGRSVAAMLPMALCDVHRLDRPLEQESNAGNLLRQTIETATQQSAEQVQCDYWSAPAAAGKPGWTQALTVPRSWTDRLSEDIAEAGWSCEAIDGLPMVMVRAVGLIADPSVPVAALDWGHSRATLCLIDQGQAAYVRCLKDCGLSHVLAALVDALQITEIEAQRLLEEGGLSAGLSGASPDATAPRPAGSCDAIAQLVQDIIAEPVSQLAEEIKRSLSHYQFLRRAAKPQALVLLGGGAMINELPARLSTHLEIAVQKWQLPIDDTDPLPRDSSADCLLAPAIALSTLAWEAP